MYRLFDRCSPQDVWHYRSSPDAIWALRLGWRERSEPAAPTRLKTGPDIHGEAAYLSRRLEGWQALPHPRGRFHGTVLGPVDALFAKCAWWSFARANGEPWMIAGLWNDWKDPQTGAIVPSYTMVTMNADAHPLVRLMHKPERDREIKVILPAELQDKRSVVPVAREDWDTWLTGTPKSALARAEGAAGGTVPAWR